MNNINLRIIHDEPYGYEKIYVDKYLLEEGLYQLIDQCNERKICHRVFCFVLLDKIHSLYDGNGRICKIIFVSNFNKKLWFSQD